MLWSLEELSSSFQPALFPESLTNVIPHRMITKLEEKIQHKGYR